MTFARPYVARKSSAADRTVDMFAPKVREIEVLEEAPKEAGRVGHIADADRMRDNAFKVQEWTSKNFGLQDTANQYRLTHRGEHYYLESVSDSRYCGLFVHESDLIAVATVFVGAARKLAGK